MQKLLRFFSKNISINATLNYQSFNDMLTNDIVSFEQLGPGVYTSKITQLKSLWRNKQLSYHIYTKCLKSEQVYLTTC